ncbi:MAG: oligosaccharide flippase family protein [Methylococcales bacterium]
MDNSNFSSLTKIKNKIISGGIWVTSGFVINAFAGLIIGILVSRILTTHDVGVYYLIFSIVISGSMFGQLGLNRTVVKFTANALASNNSGVARSTAIRMLTIVTLVSAVYLTASYIPYTSNLIAMTFGESSLQQYLLIIGLWMALNTLRVFLAELFRGAHNIKMAAITQRILVNVIFLAGLTAIWIYNSSTSLDSILILITASTLIVVIIAIIFNTIWVKQLPAGQPEPYRSILSASAPLFISQSLLLLSNQFPIWVLGATQAESSVAVYAIASRIAFIVSLPLLIANNVIMPLVAGMYKTNQHEKLSRLLSYSVVVTSILSTIIAILFFLYGDKTLTLLFGADYTKGYTSLIFLSIGLLFNVYAGSSAILLAMSGNESSILFSISMSVIITILASFILIPAYGSAGAAISYSSGLIIYNFFLASKAKQATGITAYLDSNAIKSLSQLILKLKK